MNREQGFSKGHKADNVELSAEEQKTLAPEEQSRALQLRERVRRELAKEAIEQPQECPDELWGILASDALITQEWLFKNFEQERSEWEHAGKVDVFDSENKWLYENAVDQSEHLRKMVAFLYGTSETEEPFSYKDLDDLFSVIDAQYKESRPTIADKLRHEVASLFEQQDPRVHLGSQSLRRGLNTGKIGHLEKNGILRGEEATLLKDTLQFAEVEAYGEKDMIDTLQFAANNTELAVGLLSKRVGLSSDIAHDCLTLVLSEMEAEHDNTFKDDDASKKSWLKKVGQWFMGNEVSQTIPLPEKVQSVLEHDGAKWAHRLVSLLATSKQKDIDRRYFKDELYKEEEIRNAILDFMRNDEGDDFSLDQAEEYLERVVNLSQFDRASADDLGQLRAQPEQQPTTVWGKMKRAVQRGVKTAVTEIDGPLEEGESAYLISPRMLRDAKAGTKLDLFVDAVEQLERYPGDKRNPAFIESAQAVERIREQLTHEYDEFIKLKEAHKKAQESTGKKPFNGGIDTADTKATSGAEWFSVETMMEPLAMAGEKILGFAGDQVKKFVDRMKKGGREKRQLRNEMIDRIGRAGGGPSRPRGGSITRRSSSRVSSPLRSSIR